MLDTTAAFETSRRAHAEPYRDRMATRPHDLSEYARVVTGPASFSAHPQADRLAAWALDAHLDPTFARTTDLLVDISPTDIPHVMLPADEIARLVSHREAFVVASIDGHSTLETIPDTVDLPSGEVLAIICHLCARGILDLDRSGRLADRR
jgi:hypothetical protein